MKCWKYDLENKKKRIHLKKEVYCFDTIQTLKTVLADVLRVNVSNIALFINNDFVGFPLVKKDFDNQKIYYHSDNASDEFVNIEKRNIQKNINTTDILLYESTTPIYLLSNSTKDVIVEVLCVDDLRCKKMFPENSLLRNVFWPLYDKDDAHIYKGIPPQYSKYFECLEMLNNIKLSNEKSGNVMYGIKQHITLKNLYMRYCSKNILIKDEDLENTFKETELNAVYPTMSLTLKELKRTYYGIYTGKGTPLRIQDVKNHVFEKGEPFKTGGLAVSRYPSSNIIEVQQDNVLIRIRDPIKIDESNDMDDIIQSTCKLEWNNFIQNGPTNVINLLKSGVDIDFDIFQINKISLSWKLSVPIGNLLAVVNHPVIKNLFKRVSKNDYTNHYSQSIYQFQYQPVFQKKLNTKGIHGLPRIQCSIRNTSTNVLTVFICAESKTKTFYHYSFINFILDVWKTIILDTVIKSRVNTKKSISESGYSFTSLKDGNPGLFRDSARKGGYSRKSQNHRDDRLLDKNGKHRQRYRQPVIIDWNNPKDQEMYYSLKHPSWVLESMGVFYAAIRDELENGDAIEEYNTKHPNNKIDYFNKLVMFEIYEEDYLSDDAQSGLIWPVCQQSKTKLSRRHLDAMRPAYQNGTLKIHGVDADVLKRELENPLYIMDNEVGYIMKTSRTLPINGYGRLLQDKSGMFEWFRQHTINFKLGFNEYLRKGTIHDDEYNIFHAVVDALNIDQYQTKTFEQKRKITQTFVQKCVSGLSVRMFRVLENGTLATKITYDNFIEELRNPCEKLLHTSVLDMLCRITKTNIVVFDNDARSDSVETYWLNTFGMYEQSIFLLKIRNNYETIVFYEFKDDQPKVPISVFGKNYDIVRLIDKLIKESIKNNVASNTNRTITRSIENILQSEFKGTIIGQCVNAKNQTTHLVTSVFNIPIPLLSPNPPFDNIVMLPKDVLDYKTTLTEFMYISQKVPEYTPNHWVVEHDIVIALALRSPLNTQSGTQPSNNIIYVDIIPINVCDLSNSMDNASTQLGDSTATSLASTLKFIDNRNTNNPYYPNIDDAFILSIQQNDDRVQFVQNLKRVRKCIFDLKTDLFNNKQSYIKLFDDNFFNKESAIPKQEYRKIVSDIMKDYLTKKLYETDSDVLNTHYTEIHFVLLSYLYRNPDFFKRDVLYFTKPNCTQHIGDVQVTSLGDVQETESDKTDSKSSITRKFFSTKHINDWIQTSTESSFIGTKAKIEGVFHNVSYKPSHGSMITFVTNNEVIPYTQQSTHLVTHMLDVLSKITKKNLLESYVQQKFPDKQCNEMVKLISDKCNVKLHQFHNKRNVCGSDISFDLLKKSSYTFLLYGIALFFLFGKKLHFKLIYSNDNPIKDLGVNSSTSSIMFGYDDGSEPVIVDITIK